MEIGVITENIGDQDNTVEKILKNPVETWVVSHRELKTSRKIRFVFDAYLKV